MTSPRPAAAVLLALYASLVLWVTLGPVPWAGEGHEATGGVLDWRIWLEPSTWSIGSEREFALNVIMFVPIGALLAVLLRGAVVPAVLAVGFTAFIEVTQVPLAERISDPRDLVANTFGALVGFAAARLVQFVVGLATPRRPAPSLTRSPQRMAPTPSVGREREPATSAAGRR